MKKTGMAAKEKKPKRVASLIRVGNPNKAGNPDKLA